MKAISFWQPYAHLVQRRLKRFTGRSWSTSYRGEIAIHATQRIPRRAEIEQLRQAAGGISQEDLPSDPHLYPTGAIIAVGTLVDCLEVTPELIDQQSQLELAVGFWQKRFVLELANIEPLPEAIPTRGQWRLWDWHQDRSPT